MSVLPIVEIPDPRLRLVCTPVAEIDAETLKFTTDMLETMYAAHGIGLAAIQVGITKRVVVIDLQEREVESDDTKPEARRDPHVFINPEITWASEEQSIYSEGCLSIPEQYAEVERPARCRVTWLDESGQRHEEEFSGLMATCMQHEIDHLNGVLFIDHISRLKRQMLLKKLDKARKSAA